jgi:hypothetical protein
MADPQVGIQLTKIVIPMIIVFGVVSNLLNIIILTRRTLRPHACSKYFLAMAINNVLYSSVVLIYRLLIDGYQIDLSTGSLIQCKITVYLTNLCAFISPYFIVLASIDRWCASSTSPRQRKWSSVRTARWILIITIIVSALVFIPFAISAEISFDDGYECNSQITSISMNIYFSVELVIFAGIAPFLMILFGLLTIYNTQQIRVVPIAQNRRTEAQLARMLLLQVGSHVLLTLPLCILYLMSVIPSSFQATSSFYFAITILMLPFHLSYTTGCVLYILSARVYRLEFIRLFRKMTGNRAGNGDNRIHATVLPVSTVGHTHH